MVYIRFGFFGLLFVFLVSAIFTITPFLNFTLKQ